MEIFKNKVLVKLIASLCIFLTLLNFGLTKHSYASGDDDVYGGVLINPIMKLLTGIADGIMDILHSSVLEQTETLIRLDGTADTWWNRHGAKVLGWIAAIVIIGVIVAAGIASGGTIFAAGAGIMAHMSGAFFVIKTVGMGLAYGFVGGVIVAKVVDAAMMEDDLFLPVFKLTPEEIFANKIAMFDVNFFNPNNYTRKENVTSTETVSFEQKTLFTQNCSGSGDVPAWVNLHNISGEFSGRWLNETKNQDFASKSELDGFNWENYNSAVRDLYDFKGNTAIKKILEEINKKQKEDHLDTIEEHELKVYTLMLKGYITALDSNNTQKTYYIMKIKNKNDGQVEYTIKYSCTNTGGTNFCPADITIIREAGSINASKTEEVEVKMTSTAEQLKEIISKWYFILRNLALLVLMLVLVYSGIRIVLGSTAGEKAKYKERLMDWLVAMCLLFVMHYIMFFAVELTESIIEMIDLADGNNGIIREIQLKKENHIKVVTERDELSKYLLSEEALVAEGLPPGTKILEWGTDLMGGMRIDQQLVKEGTLNWIGYSLCYLILTIYTLIFAWTYLRRVLYMAFLTIISPLVAMTYPIDKLTDGKAQAFNAWLKEYIFNLLLQPFHLLLYIVLVGAAYDLAGENAIYAVIAVGFMTPAEKLLRRFFGFEKAQTPGLLGGAAGAALAMTGMKSMMQHGANTKGGENAAQSQEDSGKIKFSSSDGVNAKGVIASGRRIPSDSEIEEQEQQENVAANIRTQNANANETNTRTVIPGGQAQKTTVADSASEEARRIPKNASQLNIPQSNMRTESVINGGIGTNGGVAVPKRRIYARTGSTAQRVEQRADKSPEWLNNMRERLPEMPSGLKTAGRVASAGVGGYFRALGQKNYKRINKMRPIRSLARGIAGAAGAATFGMAGLALGIASGDPSKAFQYTTAGLAGGYGAGKGLGGSAVDAFSVDTNQLKDEIEMEYYGEDYKKVKLQQEKDSMVHNEEYIKYLRQTLGVNRKDAQNILRTTGKECFDSGITKIEDIAAIENMSQEDVATWEEENKEMLEKLDKEDRNILIQQHEEESRKSAMSMKKFSDRTPDLSKLGAKKRKSYRDQFKKEMKGELKSRLIKQGETEELAEKKADKMADDAADEIISGIIRFDDAKSKILEA